MMMMMMPPNVSYLLSTKMAAIDEEIFIEDLYLGYPNWATKNAKLSVRICVKLALKSSFGKKPVHVDKEFKQQLGTVLILDQHCCFYFFGNECSLLSKSLGSFQLVRSRGGMRFLYRALRWLQIGCQNPGKLTVGAYPGVTSLTVLFCVRSDDSIFHVNQSNNKNSRNI